MARRAVVRLRQKNRADDLLALLDELGHDRVALVDHDWDGWIGFLAALREHARFDASIALGIIHPFPQPSPASLANAWRGACQLLLASPLLGETMLRTSPRVVAEAIRLGCHERNQLGTLIARQTRLAPVAANLSRAWRV